MRSYCSDEDAGCDVDLIDALMAEASALRRAQINARKGASGSAKYTELRWNQDDAEF